MKRIPGILLALILAVSMMPLTAFADSPPGSGNISKENVFAFEKSAELDSLRREAKDFYPAFDLREYGTVTSVKQQAPFGTCWGFAAIAAAESSLIADGIAGNDIDLSEKHLAYYAMSYIDDHGNPQNGEGVHFKRPTGQALQKYDMGGDPTIAASLFASGVGPVSEKRSDYLVYKGHNGEKATRRVAVAYDAAGNPAKFKTVPVWYSEEDDWSIPEKYRFYHSYRLKESYDLPNPTASPDEKLSEAEGVLAIKHQLQKKHRAVSVSYSSETFLPGDTASDMRFMSNNWAHYTWDEDCSADHAVTIVGWDDNYPRENFRDDDGDGSKLPPADGAWLIKNSWGSELNDPETMNNGYRHFGMLEGQDCVPYDPDAKAVSDRATGYFWISYYDHTLTMAEAFAFEKAADEYSYIEQMDSLPMIDFDMTARDGSKMANVFMAKTTSKLTDISVFTTTPGTDVSYKVYLLPDRFSSPEKGLLVEKGKQSYEYGGYHLITLKNQTVLARNQKYSVVVTETAPESGDYVCYAKGADLDDITLTAVVNTGESFYYSDKKWKDLSKEKTQNELLESDEINTDNFPIKAYLEKVTYVDDEGNTQVFDGYLTVSNWEEGNPGRFELQTHKTKTLAAEFKGIKNGTPPDWNPDYNWKSSNPKIATVTARKNNTGDVTVKGVSEGSAYIVADAGDWGVRLINIDVFKPQVLWFHLSSDETEYTYTGKPIRPEVESVTADSKFSDGFDEDLKEGVDYEVVYENNTNVGTGLVYVKGIGEYGGQTDPEEFTILPSKAADLKKTTFRKLALRSAKQTKTSVDLKWKKAANASSYVIYGNKCGKSNKLRKLAAVSGNAATIKTIGERKLKKGTYYKFIVVALDKNNNVVSTSKMIHVATRGGKAGNYRKVSVGKAVAEKAKKLRKGERLKLNVKPVAQSNKLKVKKHRAVRYESGNKKIAKVSGKGIVTAKGKGICYIYAYAQNGVYKKIKIIVK